MGFFRGVAAGAVAALAMAVPGLAQASRVAKAEQILQAADAAAKAKDLRKALSLYKQAQRAVPDDEAAAHLAARADLGLGVTLAAGGKTRDAARALRALARAQAERALSAPGSGERSKGWRALLRTALAELEAGTLTPATVSAVADLPDAMQKDWAGKLMAPAAQFVLGEAAEQRKDWAAALAAWQPAAEARTADLVALAAERAKFDATAVHTPAKPPKAGAPAGTLTGKDLAAVEAGLDWLMRFQPADGCWDDRQLAAGPGGADLPTPREPYEPSTLGAALATLAFLRAGVDVDHPTRGAALRRALDWCLAAGGDTGRCTPASEKLWVVAHAHWTWALALAVERCADGARYRERLQKAVDVLLDAQNVDAAWRYGRRPGDNDSECTAAAYWALLRARQAGAEVPDDALDGGHRWLDWVTDPVTGRVGFTSRGDLGAVRMSSRNFKQVELATAQALACRALAGEDPRTGLLARGYDLLWARVPDWQPDVDLNLGYALAYTLAYGLRPGADANHNLDRCAALLVEHQAHDVPAAGSWPAIGVLAHEGQVAATARAILAICNARGVRLPTPLKPTLPTKD